MGEVYPGESINTFIPDHVTGVSNVDFETVIIYGIDEFGNPIEGDKDNDLVTSIGVFSVDENGLVTFQLNSSFLNNRLIHYAVKNIYESISNQGEIIVYESDNPSNE